MRKFALLFLLLLSAQAFAVELPRVRTLNGHKVVFQSQEARFVRSLELYKARVVARWGVHVFEVADAYFSCGPRRCRLQETRTRAFFESCRARGEAFRCERRIRPTSATPESDYEQPGYWERHADDGDHHRDQSSWEGSDFPERDGSDWETGGIVLF